MSKRRPKKVVKTADVAARLRKALAKRTKGDLVEVLVELAREDRKILRQLDARFELEAPPKELAAATRQAIADATDFDERDINRNFSYDYAAYEGVKRNLSRLVDLGQLRLAMELSLELMKQGSHQVEMSDEGLMTARHRGVSGGGHESPQEVRPAAGRDSDVVRQNGGSRPRGIRLRPGASGTAEPLRGVAVVMPCGTR